MTWYRFFQLLFKPVIRALAKVEVVGVENVPASGPFVLVANHQSVLDPVFVQVICPRPLHTLTKSTQFSGRVMGWILPRLNALPTRRYRVDPQVVRVVLRRLASGEAVGIYPEGERSWDGALQPFRRGTIRLLLRAGVAVIPCGVAGAYDVWPRWSRKPVRLRVRVEFGRPLVWPAMKRREEREAALADATAALGEALGRLGGWERLEGGKRAPQRPRAPSDPPWLAGG